ncbi:hypothetical protein FIBSPDRAFT_876237 [Athelia psychrophila]|uniref:Uncharacterized protein n=1 Tax=Athelia psychrophila TaxID=1759441 RepID=A0A167X255_9AGAM|nr:hypothetical protein FIBSPDRAFT_876237 [Fibularhizoctonia sp. CBS 109695]
MSGVTDAGARMQHRQRDERSSDIASMKARDIPEWGEVRALLHLRCKDTLGAIIDHRSPRFVGY